MDTTNSVSIAQGVFDQIRQLIQQGQAEALANSTNGNGNSSATNAFSQIQQTFETQQAQVLASLTPQEGTSTSTAPSTTSPTAATDSSTVATTSPTAATSSSIASTDSSTVTSTAAAPSLQSQFAQVGQSQVQASLATDSLTNPGSADTSNSDSLNFQFVPAESGSESFGQVNATIGGETTTLFSLGNSGPVSNASNNFSSLLSDLQSGNASVSSFLANVQPFEVTVSFT